MSVSDYVIYCDESGQSHGLPYYTIGALTLPRVLVPALDSKLQELRAAFEISERFGELKWKKVKDDQGLRYVNLMTHIFHFILCHPDIRLLFIVVHKGSYVKWKRTADREGAFYHTYNQLISYASRHISGTYEVVMDRRCDSYKRWPEAMECIANRMLNKRGSNGSIGSVKMVNSKEHPIVQLIDLFTGAINTAHVLERDSAFQMQAAKKVAMHCVARVLGWSHLAHDTYPRHKESKEANEIFNVWHFPPETRGPSMSVPNVDKLRVPVPLTDARYACALRHPFIQNPFGLRRPQANVIESSVSGVVGFRKQQATGLAYHLRSLAAPQ